MRRLTAEQSQWKADTQNGSSLTIQRCKGGFFSTKEEYGLKVIGHQADNRCVKTGTRVTATSQMTVATAWINASNQLAYSSDSFSVRLSVSSSTQYELFLDSNATSLFRAGVTSSSAMPVLGAPITLSPCVRGNAPDHITLNAGTNARFIWVQIASGQRQAIYSLTVIDKSNGTTFKPFVMSEVIVPCDLYEGDVWYPMSGKVGKANGVVEWYDPQPIFAPQGTVQVTQTPVELSADLSATMLVRR